MSGSDTGAHVMSSSAGLQKSPVPAQPAMQTVRLSFPSDANAVYNPTPPANSPPYQAQAAASGGGGGGESSSAAAGGAPLPLQEGPNMNVGFVSEPMKKKRGRPRKYGPDGTMSLALVPAGQSQAQANSGFPSLAGSGPSTAGSGSPTSLKKARGRPPGSSKKQQLEALGSAGVGFTPHVITVKTGEDVSSKIMSFSQHGPRAVCILSANGAISNVTLRQAATSGGTVTYEGRFEILSLSGSFMLSENGGQRSRTGGLSVSLSGPDGRVLGGGVAGLLMAASPVQVVVGSFIANGRKEHKSSGEVVPSSAPPKVNLGSAATGTSSPPSRGVSESSGGPGSPLNQSTGACNDVSPQGMSNMPWK